MKKIIALCLCLVLSAALCGCREKPSEAPPKTEPTPQTLAFAEGRREDKINWFGRCFWDEEAQSVCFSNSSAGFEVRFIGTSLTAKIAATDSAFPQEAAEKAYLYVFIDGEKDYKKARHIELDGSGEPAEYVLAQNLQQGEHTVRVLKCTEVKYGSAWLYSLRSDGEFLAPPPRAERRVELIGDSILSGSESMRESTTTDSKLTESENSLASYGAFAADLLDAEVSAVTRSGALISGYRGYASIQDFYDLYSADCDALWDFSLFQPDVIILDLGTNDFLVGAPTDLISEKYSEFLAYVRRKNPDSAIFCCAGAMVTAVNRTVSAAVEQRNAAGDKNVWYYALPVIASGGHPREEQHLSNGYQLGAFILQSMGWTGEL